VRFSLPKATANNSAVGAVVGLRIVKGTAANVFNTPYDISLNSKIDLLPQDLLNPQFVDFTTGLNDGTYYYYKVYAIRYDARFTKTASRFFGLSAGQYLSVIPNLPSYTKIFTPPYNHYYFHPERTVVDKALTGDQYKDYPTASSYCGGRPSMAVRDPSSTSRNYTLINAATWALLLATPAATNYVSMDSIPHWLSDAPVSPAFVASQAAADPLFNPSADTDLLNTAKIFYSKDSNNLAAALYLGIGGIPGAPFSNYNSYIHPAFPFGSARCMVVLPP
jgi:hypothetical protein